MKMQQKNHLFAVLLVLLFAVPPASANRTDEINAVFGWLESTYPRFFSPSSVPTQTLGKWTYRHYTDTGVFAGVDDQDDLYVFGLVFGGRRYIDTLTSLLDTIGYTDPPGGSCVTVPTILNWTDGMRFVYEDTKSGTISDATYEVTLTGPSSYCALQTTTTTSNFGSSISRDESCGHVSDGNLYFDSLTFYFGNGGSMTQEFASPGLLYGPVLACEGATWDSGMVETTATGTFFGDPITTTSTSRTTGTVEAVHESVTTGAGTFDTVRYHGTQFSNGFPVQEIVAWTDIVTGVVVKQNVFSPGNPIPTTLEVTLIE